MSERDLPFSLDELDHELSQPRYEATPEGFYALSEREQALVMAGAQAALNIPSPPTPPEFRIEHDGCGGVVYGYLTSGLDLRLECQASSCQTSKTITL